MKLEGQARDCLILDILKGIEEATKVGEHRQSVWDDTWEESLIRLKRSDYDPAVLTPRYFTQHEPYRIRGEFYSSDEGWEVLKHTQYLREKLFRTWFRDAEILCEFGCGSGWNLAYWADQQPSTLYRGFDWSVKSCVILEQLGRRRFWQMWGSEFDMFSPPPSMDVVNDATVFTWGAMEQLGDRFQPFVDWLIERRPKLVLNVEPILDFYDPSNLSDFLCGQYHTKRGYLAGFLPYLKKLEKDGVIAIDTIHRERFCGKYHEALSHIVWRPL